MDRLALHIEYLLLRHDCVVVPDFGAFINVRHSAVQDDATGLILPMTREVRFNSALSHDDGLLANSYARRERIGFAEGRELLRLAVKDLRTAMSLDGEVTMGRLGRLVADSDGNISFHPMESPERVMESLGFYAAPARHVAAAATERLIPAEMPRNIIPDINPEPAVDNGNVERPEHQFDTERNYYIPVNKTLARAVASLALIAVIALAVLLPIGRDLHEDQASVVPVKAITEALSKQEKAAPTPAAAEAEVAAPGATAPEETAMDEPYGPWHLIVATFHSAADADKFIAANAGKGYELSTVSSRKLCRVSARSVADKQTLLDELNKSSFRESFPQAWIYKDEK